MAFTTAQLTALRTELDTDPNGYGYAPFVAAGADQACADLVNLIRAGISIARSNVPPQEVIEAIDISHLKSSTTAIQASWFESFTQLASVQLLKQNGNNTRVMDNLLLILTNGSASETRLKALAVRTGSRAEALFGEGAQVGALDVAHAYGRGL